jgi:hypothetical protein
VGRPGFASGVSTVDDCAPIRATNKSAAAPTKPQRSSLLKTASRKKSERTPKRFFCCSVLSYARGVSNGGE